MELELNSEFAVVTKAKLYDIFHNWEQAYRNGGTLSHEAKAMLPIEQIAEECAQHVWEQL